MKGFFSVVGVFALLACLWIGLMTIRQGGIKTIDENGQVTSVLTADGWSPAGGSGNAAAVEAKPAQEYVVAIDAAVKPQPAEAPPPQTERPALPTAVPAAPTEVALQPTTAPTREALVSQAGHPGEAEPIEPSPQEQPAALPNNNGDLPAVWSYDPVGPGGYAAEPIAISPWSVLGWILVGTVPAGGLVYAIVYIHRQVTLTRAQAAALGRPAQESSGQAGPAGPETSEIELEEIEPEVDIGSYLSGKTSLQAQRSPAAD